MGPAFDSMGEFRPFREGLPTAESTNTGLVNDPAIPSVDVVGCP